MQHMIASIEQYNEHEPLTLSFLTEKLWKFPVYGELPEDPVRSGLTPRRTSELPRLTRFYTGVRSEYHPLIPEVLMLKPFLAPQSSRVRVMLPVQTINLLEFP